jgi:hypothetical protein
MTTVREINQTCTAFADAGFAMETVDPQQPRQVKTILPKEKAYHLLCVEELKFARKSEHRYRHHTLWNKDHVLAMKRAAAKEKIPLRIVTLKHPFGLHGLSGNNRTVYVSLAIPTRYLPSEIHIGIHHEAGHFHDRQMMAAKFPKEAEWILNGGHLKSQIRAVVDAYLSAALGETSPADRSVFNAMARKLFGAARKEAGAQFDTTLEWLYEALRMGDDIKNATPETKKFDLKIAQLKKGYSEKQTAANSITDSQGRMVDLDRILFVAKLREEGIWEAYTREEDYDPNAIKNLSEEDIRYAQMLIRAYAEYFPN